MPPLLDSYLYLHLSWTTIGVEMENRPDAPSLLLTVLERTDTYGVRFTLLRRQQAWLNNELVMDESRDYPVVLCKLAYGYVTTDFVDLILNISKHPNGIH
jgi:hypothetical protein